jgi:RNA polymerase sigma-70 factor (ECF subfamily)
MGETNWEQLDEEVVVLQARAGDLKAFDLLARRYRPAVLAIARSFLPSDEAQDAAQDSLILAYKNLGLLGDAGRFGSWLYAVTRNRCLRLRDGLKRLPATIDEIIVAYAPAIAERIEEDRRATILREALAKLDEDHRLAVELHYLEGWTAAQIAGFLSLPLSTVKWRLHTARTKLRNRLWSLEESNEPELK